MDCDGGVTVKPEMVMYTVACAVFCTASDEAVIVTIPSAIPFKTALPVPVTVAMDVSLLDQETPLVRFSPCPVLSTPKADKVVVPCTRTDGAAGLIVIEVKVGGWKKPLHPAPKAAISSTVKAAISGSFFPVNLRSVAINKSPRNRVILAERPASARSPVVHEWSRVGISPKDTDLALGVRTLLHEKLAKTNSGRI